MIFHCHLHKLSVENTRKSILKLPGCLVSITFIYLLPFSRFIFESAGFQYSYLTVCSSYSAAIC